MKVGFIGLGRMGQGMARRVLDAGNDLIVYNRTAAKAEDLRAAGATVVENVAAADADARRLDQADVKGFSSTVRLIRCACIRVTARIREPVRCQSESPH